MKTRQQYKRPMFFGWYTIPSANKKDDEWKSPLSRCPSSDMDYLYKG